MSFKGSEGRIENPYEVARIKDCTPDYQAQAANLKKKLDSTMKLDNALEDFSVTNDIYLFTDISSFAELIGSVVITLREQQTAYDYLLEQIKKAK